MDKTTYLQQQQQQKCATNRVFAATSPTQKTENDKKES